MHMLRVPSIFLAKNGGSTSRGAGPDPTLADVFIELFSDLSKFHRCYSVISLRRWYRVRQKVHFMFNSSLRKSKWLLKNILNSLQISPQCEGSVHSTLVLSKLDKAILATLDTGRASRLCNLAPTVKSREQAAQLKTGLVDFSQFIPRIIL